MARTVSIGNQDFESIRRENYFYVDKTHFIKEWWECGDSVTLINRPRRFGKTLNMNMLEKFFSVEYAGREDLFQGLCIWEEEKYRALQGTYPVIMLSFAKVKETTYRNAQKKMCQIIASVYNHFYYLLDREKGIWYMAAPLEALLFLIPSSLFFRFGLKRYQSAGS